MPEELSPGYVACAACGRVVESGHVNTSGRCVLCAGKTADQIDELVAAPAGNEMAAEGHVLVTPDPASEDGERE